MRASELYLKVSGVLGVAGVLVATAGCGGGGSSTPPSNVPQGLSTVPAGTTSTITPTFHSFIGGDEWYYAVNGFKKVGGKTLHLQGGSLDRTISASGGQITIADKSRIIFDDNSESASSLSTYVTNSGTSYNEVADNAEADGNIESAGNTPCDSGAIPIIPSGAWNSGTTVTGGSAFNVPTGAFNTPPTDPPPAGFCIDGSRLTNQEQFSFTVVGSAPETITVPAGKFETWQVSSTGHYVTQGRYLNERAWWAPQIGAFVLKQSTITEADGSVANYTYQLVAFKVL